MFTNDDLNTLNTMARVERARVRLQLEKRFYAALIGRVEAVIDDKVETAATNGKNHFWNPTFVAELSDDELFGVQMHENEHDARHHSTRRCGRDPLEWNICCDYAINIDLVDDGVKLPKGALIDPKYRGMSAEDIFRSRELDRERAKKQPQPEPEEQDEDGDAPDQADTNPGQGNQDDDQDDDQDDASQDTNVSGDDGDQGDDQDGDQGDDQGKPEPGQGKPAQGTGAGEPDDQGEGEGSPTPGNQAGEAGSEAGEPAKGKPTSGQGDPGRCGEVLDAPEGTDLVEEDIEVEKAVRQAVSMAKKHGQLPGYITREIDRANNPTRDWRDELREFCEQGALSIETWNRPNRRFVGRGLILPGTQRDGVNKAIFAIDTSGSMDAVALACVRNEAQALLDDGVIDQVAVLYCDTRVTREDLYSTGDEIEFDPKGGGGTRLQPMFDHISEQHQDASLIVCFTDGYTDINNDSPEPACPVLWAFTGYPDEVRRMIANAPWGAKAVDVGAH